MHNEEQLKDAIFLIFANKQDLPQAMSTSELVERLGLNSFRGRKWQIQAAVATNGEGLYDGLDWLSKEVSSLP